MSEDSFAEVTSRSWGSRLGGSLKGIGIGLLLICVGAVALWWNEGRAVERARALEEGPGRLSPLMPLVWIRQTKASWSI